MIDIIGHRGVPPLEPENTIRGFRRALVIGAQQLEFDVRLTKDLVPVVIHDSTLRRTTNGRGRISKMRYEEIKNFDAGKGEGIPTLKEVLSQFGGRTYLHIDIKYRVPPGKIIALVTKAGLERSVCISSFSHRALRAVKRANPHISTAALMRKKRRRLISYLHTLGVDALHIPYRKCTASLVNTLHAGGLKIRVWGVPNDISKMKHLLALKVDGMIVDRPDVLKRIL